MAFLLKRYPTYKYEVESRQGSNTPLHSRSLVYKLTRKKIKEKNIGEKKKERKKSIRCTDDAEESPENEKITAGS